MANAEASKKPLSYSSLSKDNEQNYGNAGNKSPSAEERLLSGLRTSKAACKLQYVYTHTSQEVVVFKQLQAEFN